MKILLVSGWYPFPADNGSKVRIYGLLKALAQQHEVTLFSFDERARAAPTPPELAALCRDVQTVPWKSFDASGWRARLGYLSPKPRMIVDTYSPQAEECLRRLLSENQFDVIIASQFRTAMYSAVFRGVPSILEELELGIFHDAYHKASGWNRWRNGLTWIKHKRWVATILKDFSACTLVSPVERTLAQAAVPHYRAFEVVPNCVDLDQYSGIDETPQPNTLIFTGSFSYYPNYEAMCWFLAEVFPLIQREVPDAQLTVTGNTAGYELPPARNLVRTGYVDDIRPHIARAWASIVPIHQGGGTRLKILEAMALRTPVVATAKGAEGLDLRSGQQFLQADTPQEFAHAVVQILRTPALRQQLADEAYAAARTQYDGKVVYPRFLDLVERVAAGPSL